jgi:2-methylisocitrate lyase-like PEP mutase family enzyme
MTARPLSKSARLQDLIHRRDKVLTVLHPPTAAHARIMEMAGCEALFVGTGGVVGAYTGLADVGTATMTECITIAGWIADSVSIPVIMDGDTGHGGIMAVRRMVRECIRAGIAGIRIDDQPIEGKRKTQSAGIEVVPLDQAIARYRAAVDMKTSSTRILSSWRSVTPVTLPPAPWEIRSPGCAHTARKPASTGCNSSRPIRSRRSERRERR